MSTNIPAVQGTHIYPVTLIDLDLNGNIYYVSDAFKTFTVDSNDYTELGAFLSIGAVDDNLRVTNGDISVTMAGIPSSSTGSEVNYLQIILDEPIKGGNITIKRAFMDLDTNLLDTANVYTRFKGVITNYSIGEDYNFISKKNDYSVTVVCASINTLLETKISGQRTDPTDRDRFFASDPSFDRIPDLKNISFDFGKEYVRPSTYGSTNSGNSGSGRNARK